MSGKAETRGERIAEKKAGFFAVIFACIFGCVAKIGSCLGRSWCAVNPTGRIITQLLFIACVICSCIAAIPAIQDLYWGWILMLFAAVGAAFGLIFGFEERLFGPKMPNLTKLTPGKPAKMGCLLMTRTAYYISIACWLGIIGISAYILYLYIQPIARGFTSAEAVILNPPQYCDRVVGQSSKWILPTNSSSYCDEVANQWRRGAASTGIGLGIMLLCLFFGSCLHGGTKEVLILLAVRRQRMEDELQNRHIAAMQQQVTTQQAQISAQEAQISELKTSGAPPSPTAAPAAALSAPVPQAAPATLEPVVSAAESSPAAASAPSPVSISVPTKIEAPASPSTTAQP